MDSNGVQHSASHFWPNSGPLLAVGKGDSLSSSSLGTFSWCLSTLWLAPQTQHIPLPVQSLSTLGSDGIRVVRVYVFSLQVSVSGMLFQMVFGALLSLEKQTVISSKLLADAKPLHNSSVWDRQKTFVKSEEGKGILSSSLRVSSQQMSTPRNYRRRALQLQYLCQPLTDRIW